MSNVTRIHNSQDAIKQHMRRAVQAKLEEKALYQIIAVGLPMPERQYVFWEGRRFRFDFAWPQNMIAYEVEGGTWNKGGHVRGGHYRSDCIKYSHAAIFGWVVIRATTDMVRDGTGIELLEQAFEAHTG